ncbi:MAG: tRNA (N(6)-L-threonylcarbamoyladenosine(37)-C(2))-methylthiotransferase MtaB [Desulfobacteraceae bacterium]|nr:tRNA (N(6)-L-threonylcarbamoyladenosine(37)-C(2))-methylthiotransferase MtaB [Desulfobacteraceae bacterium]
MKKYSIATLGCKVNQCESAALGRQLEKTGYRTAHSNESPDTIIINTCTVTGKAAMQSRQLIRQLIRNHPEAKIVVTGCYAQTAPEQIKTIQGTHLIVGHTDKLAIPELLNDPCRFDSEKNVIVEQNIFKSRCFDPLPYAAPEQRTRAFLKIQDGCNAMCTYCIVPFARGRSRSMPAADVLEHLKKLADDGFLEVVLTGIHLGAYGIDFNPPQSLTSLLELIFQKKIIKRIRLSSIEPTEINSRILDVMAEPDGCVCHHFHIPLQSGDNSILKKMGRPYLRQDYARTVHIIREKFPRAAIGADVLAGFPGEDEKAFANTYNLIDHLPVSYLHVFPYSPRKGTPAAGFKNKVPERIVKQRCKELRLLGEQKKAQFYRSMIGQTVEVLVETEHSSINGLAKATSNNYVPVLLSSAGIKANTLIRARIKSVGQDNRVYAVID